MHLCAVVTQKEAHAMQEIWGTEENTGTSPTRHPAPQSRSPAHRLLSSCRAGQLQSGGAPCPRLLCNMPSPFGNASGPRFMSANIVLRHESTATWHYLTGMHQPVAIAHISHPVASKFSSLSITLPQASDGANAAAHRGWC